MSRPSLLHLGVSLAALLGGTRQAVAGPPVLSTGWLAGVAARQAGASGAAGLSTEPGSAATGIPSNQLSRVAQSLADMQRAAQAVASMTAIQQQARASALAAARAVPNGLAPRGLVVDPLLGFSGAKLPVASPAAAGRTTVTITQTGQQALLNWSSFNVGRNTTLAFNQSAGGAAANTWVALNRVTDPNAAPSRILGQITAPGQVYIINRNGVIFGGSAQVDVGALIASTADVSTTQFLDPTAGIFSQEVNGALEPAFAAAAGTVTVQPGARITTNTPLTAVDGGGFVLLMGSSVTNAGQITTPNGQTVLAAGHDFVLTPGAGTATGTVPTTRGIQVEAIPAPHSFVQAVENDGLITATTGDITLVGRTVTQSGVLASTTTVDQRGTIHLLTDAADVTANVTLSPGSVTVVQPDTADPTTALDTVRAGARSNSATDNATRITAGALPLDDQSSIADIQDQSRIEITSGGTVRFAGGSLTMAQAGQVAVSAGNAQAAATAADVTLATSSRILIDAGAAIDVSGLPDVTLPASVNQVGVNIQGFELRDAPVSRDSGGLASATATVDINQLLDAPATAAYPSDRLYTAGGLLEVSGEVANIGHTIGEWSTIGGTVTLSANAVIAQAGSTLNVAGGVEQIQSGTLPNTFLVASNGTIQNVNTASALLDYTGVYTGSTYAHPRWGVTQTFTTPLVAPSATYQAGYVVGRDAGQVVVSAPTAVLDATIDAGVVDGPLQSTARPASLPGGDPFLLGQTVVAAPGGLTVGRETAVGLSPTLYASDVVIGAPAQSTPSIDVPTVVAADTPRIATATSTLGTIGVGQVGALSLATPLPTAVLDTVTIEPAVLNAAGLGALTIATAGDVLVNAPLTLADGGALRIIAASTDIASTITARAGSLSVTNQYTTAANLTGASTPIVLPASGLGADITLESGVSLDLRGVFTNRELDPLDASGLAPSGLAYVNGGDVTLSSTAALNLRDGSVIDVSSGAAVTSTGGTLAGLGGDITLAADAAVGGVLAANPRTPVINATLRGFGVAGGGTLSITAPVIQISDNASDVSPPASLNTAGATLPVGTEPTLAELGVASPASSATSSGSVSSGSTPLLLPSTDHLSLAPSLFQQGFSSYVVNGTESVNVSPGLALRVTEPVYRFVDSTLSAPSGTAPAAALPVVLLPEYIDNNAAGTLVQRAGASLTLRSVLTTGEAATGGTVQLGRGSAISVDPSQSVTIEAAGQVTALGSITAPSGTISLLDDRYDSASGQTLQYVQGQSVWVGAGAVLDVAARASSGQDAYGRTIGVAPAGGSIILGGPGGLDANGDPISTAAAVIIRPGAVLDASGTSAVTDLLAGTSPVLSLAQLGQGQTVPKTPVTLDSNGGSITLRSQTGIYDDGTLLAAAGGPGGSGGALTIDTVAAPVFNPGNGPTFSEPNTLRVPREILVSQAAAASGLPDDLEPGATASPIPVGQTRISAAQGAAGGFDQLALTAGDAIVFQNNVQLAAGRSIALHTLAIGDSDPDGRVTVTAPYVLLDGVGEPNAGSGLVNFNPSSATSAPRSWAPSLQTGDGSLTVQAGTIDFADEVLFGINEPVGLVTDNGAAPIRGNDVAGFANARFDASGDIRFLGEVTTSASAAAVVSPGNLAFTAAELYPVTGAVTQVVAGYSVPPQPGAIDPATGSAAVIPAASTANQFLADGTIRLGRSTAAQPAGPLSAGGSLAFAAGVIEQGGVLLAPQGGLTLGAVGLVTAGSIDGGSLPDASSYTDTVALLPGSITSVSAAGLVIPYGGTADNVSYTENGAAVATTGPIAAPALALLGQAVRLQAGSLIDLAGGGTLTGAAFISGRGGSTDVLTTPTGALGSGIAAAQGLTLAADPVYAIVAGPQPLVATPAAAAGAATAYAGSTPATGEQIVIPAGVPGLPAGRYTLEPSNEALLPGGYRVELDPSQPLGLPGNVALTDGATQIRTTIGYVGTTVGTHLPILASITPGSVVRTESNYDETSYSSFAATEAGLFGNARPQLPADAKTLDLVIAAEVAATPTLAFTTAGSARLQPASGGYGATVNVVANGTPLDIVADGAALDPTHVSIAASALDALVAPVAARGGTLSTGAGARTLSPGADGGTLSPGAGGATLSPGAGGATLSIGGQEALSGSTVQFTPGYATLPVGSAITVASGARLAAPQVFLISSAAGGITIDAGGTIDTVGAGLPVDDATASGIVYSNVGAGLPPTVLAISNGALTTLPSSPAAAAPVNIASGATLRSSGTIDFLTAGDVGIGQDVRLGAAAIAFDVGTINIGSTAALNAASATLPTGVNLTQPVLAALLAGDPAAGVPALASLTLGATSAINLYGDVDLDTLNPATGRSSLQNFTLDTPAIEGIGGPGDTARITAGNLTWTRTAAAAPPVGPIFNGVAGPGYGTGALVIAAQTLVFGSPADSQPVSGLSQDRTIQGFSSVSLTAGTTISANGAGSLTLAAAPGAGPTSLTLATPLLTGAAGSTMRYAVGGPLAITGGGTVTDPGAAALGATLELDATSIADAGTVILPGGRLVAQATGNVALQAGSRTDLSGRSVSIFGQTEPAAGGALVLASTGGSVSEDAAATIDLSGAGTPSIAAAGGSLQATALAPGQTVALNGTIAAHGVNGGTTGGSLELAAATLSQPAFDSLNARLDAGGLTGARQFEIATGDLALNGVLRAGSVAVAVDAGSLQVNGTVDASGAAPGRITLAAGQNLTVAPGAVLDAAATTLHVDQYGQPIPALNAPGIALSTTAGTLTLQPGATIDLASADGVARGTLTLSAPRLPDGGVAASAPGPLALTGASSVALDAFTSYAPTAGIVTQTNLTAAGKVVNAGAIGLDQINAANRAYIAAAEPNGVLAAPDLAGLVDTGVFHFRPGVEIDGGAATGLAVVGDLDLVGLRYGPNANPAALGSGEPGTLVLRSAGSLAVYGSITDGFAPPPDGTTAATRNPDDDGWVLRNGVTDVDLVIPAGTPAPIVLRGAANATATSPTTIQNNDILGYALPITGGTLNANASVPAITTGAPVTLAAAVTVAGQFVATGATGPFALGQIIPAGTVLPAGTTLGAGARLPQAVAINAVTWPAGVPLADFAAPVGLLGNVTVPAGGLLPAGSILAFVGTPNERAGTAATTPQGAIFADAALLPAGSLSWSLRLVSGANLAGADTEAVQPALTQAAANILAPAETPGDIVLADQHYGGTLHNLPSYSVLRTGTGTLDLVAAGSVVESTPFGVYTAGAQSPDIAASANLPRPATALGSSATDRLYATLSTGVNYQANYPTGGGDVTIAAGRDVLGDITQTSATAPGSDNLGDTLFRQAGGDGEETAGWINFGTYVLPLNAAGTVFSTQPVLTGFTGFGTLGGGNLTVRAGGDAGMTTRPGILGDTLDGQGLDLAVLGTTRVENGQVIQTGGGALTLSVAGAINGVSEVPLANNLYTPSEAPQLTDAVSGTLTDLRGNITVAAGAIGQIYQDTADYGQAVAGDPRVVSPFTADTIKAASGGFVVAPGDGAVRITTLGTLVLGGAADPTRVSEQLASPLTYTASNGDVVTAGTGGSAWFSSWTAGTAISLFSAGGTVVPTTAPQSYMLTQATGVTQQLANDAPTDLRFVYPPTLTVTAANGSILYAGQPDSAQAPQPEAIELAPAPAGQLALLAGVSVVADALANGGVPLAIDISGANPTSEPTALNPAWSIPIVGGALVTDTAANSDAGPVPLSGVSLPLFAFGPDTPTTDLHANDPQPAEIYAATGDVIDLQTGEQLSFSNASTVPSRYSDESPSQWLIAAKPVQVEAGNDIVSLGVSQAGSVPANRTGITQPGVGFRDTLDPDVIAAGSIVLNDATADVSLVAAGHDVIYANLEVAGPGTLQVQAGRNLYQGSQGVLESIGPQLDIGPLTRGTGAGITVLTGLGAAGPDYAAFAEAYLNADNVADPSLPLQSQPGRVVQDYLPQLVSFLAAQGITASTSTALAAFDALPATTRDQFLLGVYFNELNVSGLDYNDPSSRFYHSYLEGQAAIGTLFPAASQATGALTLFSSVLPASTALSQPARTIDGGIRTDAGGAITVLDPGGQTVVGVDGVTPGADAGLLTQGSGSIDVYSAGSVLLGQSRILTTLGGNVLIWSSQGDINAGQGAKTTVIVPPASVVYDNYADLTLSPTAPSSGAGIGTLAPVAGVSAGDVNLVAPEGEIDAGEAGIRASGNANLAALVVVNAANVQVGGRSTGITVTTVPNVAALASANTAATAASQSANLPSAASTTVHAQPSLITYEVISDGEDSTTPDDPKRRKR